MTSPPPATSRTSSSAAVATNYRRDGHDVSRRQQVGRPMANCCLLNRLSLPWLRRRGAACGPLRTLGLGRFPTRLPQIPEGTPATWFLRASRRHEHTRQLPPHGRADPPPCSFPPAGSCRSPMRKTLSRIRSWHTRIKPPASAGPTTSTPQRRSACGQRGTSAPAARPTTVGGDLAALQRARPEARKR